MSCFASKKPATGTGPSAGFHATGTGPSAGFCEMGTDVPVIMRTKQPGHPSPPFCYSMDSILLFNGFDVDLVAEKFTDGRAFPFYCDRISFGHFHDL